MPLGLCALLLAAGTARVAAGEPALIGEANAGPFRVLAQTSQADADRVARLLQQQAAVIGALLPELRPTDSARFRVLLLKDRRELRRFLSHRGVAGGSTFCYVHSDDWRRRRIIGYAAPNAALVRGLTHELVHALLRARVSRPPVWFDEGLAEWLELATPSKAERSSEAAPPPTSPTGPARPPVNAAWLGALKRTLAAERGALTVSALLALPAARFGRRSRQAYPLSWGLCEALGRDRLRSLLGQLDPEATERENRARLSRAVRNLAPTSVWADRLDRLSARGASFPGGLRSPAPPEQVPAGPHPHLLKATSGFATGRVPHARNRMRPTGRAQHPDRCSDPVNEYGRGAPRSTAWSVETQPVLVSE